MQTQSDTEVIANVRKKGRPRVFDHIAGFEREYRLQWPERSYRVFYEALRIANVRKKLATIVGENARVSAGGGIQCRPLLAKRWPWLLGRVVQKTVLLQLYGL